MYAFQQMIELPSKHTLKSS